MHFPSQKSEDLLHWFFRIHTPYQLNLSGTSADYNYLVTKTAREVENSMIFYFCGKTTEIAMKCVKKIYFCIV
jgi:hypothetical protein